MIFDVEPGTELEVSVSHPTLHCHGGFGWAGGDAASLRTRAFAGGFSFVTFVWD